MAAQVNAQLATAVPTMFSFTPLTVGELCRQFLDDHEHIRQSSLATIWRYLAALKHLEDVAIQSGGHGPAHEVQADKFVRFLRSIHVAPIPVINITSPRTTAPMSNICCLSEDFSPFLDRFRPIGVRGRQSRMKSNAAISSRVSAPTGGVCSPGRKTRRPPCWRLPRAGNFRPSMDPPVLLLPWLSVPTAGGYLRGHSAGRGLVGRCHRSTTPNLWLACRPHQLRGFQS